MGDFLMSMPLFCLLLTVGAFQIGLWCQKKTGLILCNPILIGAALVGELIIFHKPLSIWLRSGIKKAAIRKKLLKRKKNSRRKARSDICLK
jgi:putative effector of murein hydrolase